MRRDATGTALWVSPLATGSRKRHPCNRYHGKVYRFLPRLLPRRDNAELRTERSTAFPSARVLRAISGNGTVAIAVGFLPQSGLFRHGGLDIGAATAVNSKLSRPLRNDRTHTHPALRSGYILRGVRCKQPAKAYQISALAPRLRTSETRRRPSTRSIWTTISTIDFTST